MGDKGDKGAKGDGWYFGNGNDTTILHSVTLFASTFRSVFFSTFSSTFGNCYAILYYYFRIYICTLLAFSIFRPFCICLCTCNIVLQKPPASETLSNYRNAELIQRMLCY